MSEISTSGLQAQMQRLSAEARSGIDPEQAVTLPGQRFGDVLQALLGAVNQSQQHSSGLARAYETGATEASLAEVMVAGQKASLHFQTTLQVRNKLLSAYQDVMNMSL